MHHHQFWDGHALLHHMPNIEQTGSSHQHNVKMQQLSSVYFSLKHIQPQFKGCLLGRVCMAGFVVGSHGCRRSSYLDDYIGHGNLLCIVNFSGARCGSLTRPNAIFLGLMARSTAGEGLVKSCWIGTSRRWSNTVGEV